MNLSETEKAYLAGILDKSCWSGKRVNFKRLEQAAKDNSHRRHHGALFIRIVIDTPQLYDWIEKRLGGSVLTRNKTNDKSTNTYVHWHLSMYQAVEITKACYPYLINKKAQANILLKLEKTFVKHAHKIPDELLTKRNEIIEEFIKYNKKRGFGKIPVYGSDNALKMLLKETFGEEIVLSEGVNDYDFSFLGDPDESTDTNE